MTNWFTVKVKYTKSVDNGAFKRVSEPYLIAAMTFSDAEARVYEELGSLIKGEFMVVGIARTEIHDIFAYDDAEIWYKCKVKYDNFDADTEKAKKVTQNFLVSAHSVKQAFERIQESLSTLMVDFEIPSIMVSPIIDIFPFGEDLDREISRKPIEAAVIEEKEEDEEEKEEEAPGKGVVFTASGSDADDEEEDSEVVDEYDSE